jgi:hypothetical protein
MAGRPGIKRRAAVNQATLWRRLLAEFLGSAFLAAIVIGSGIAAQRLSPGATGLELLENAAATAAGLFAIILMFGPPVICPCRWPGASAGRCWPT